MAGTERIDAPPGEGPVRIRDGIAYALAVFVAMRILLSIAGVLFVGHHPPNPGATARGSPPAQYTQPATPGLHNALDGMQRWDASWFEWIAAEGYGDDDARGAFFPGTPLLIRAVTTVTPFGPAGAATIVANAAFAMSLIVLLALSRLELGNDDRSRRAVVLFACLPTSFFFLAPLSEAPFLLASVLAFWWARTGRWGWRVAAAGFAACLIRSIGVAVIVALVVEAVRQRRPGAPDRRARLTAALAGLLAPLCYLAWWWGRGDPLQPLRAQSYWGRDLSVPVVTIARGIAAAWRGVTSSNEAFLLVDAVFLAMATMVAVGAWRRFGPTYGVFVALAVAIPLCYAVPGRPLLSFPRFAALLFPAAWVVTDAVRSRERFALVAGASLVWQIALAVEFMRWGWVF